MNNAKYKRQYEYYSKHKKEIYEKHKLKMKNDEEYKKKRKQLYKNWYEKNKNKNKKLEQDLYFALNKIDKAIEYIEKNIDNTGWLEIGSSNVKELLKILRGKEDE